jgi:hypothetical protein
MRIIAALTMFYMCFSLSAQTESDALFMAKKNLCGGFVYGNTTWDHYWEGTFYRDNANIGTFKSNSVMAMANYGISNSLNLIASAAWVDNRVTAGTLIGQKGIQDLNLFLKKELWAKEIKGFNGSLVAVGGVSTPLSNYVADYLPLSIGMRSKTASLRLLGDVQKGHWYGTASAMYTRRNNVTIDRNAYYTTEMVYSNEVFIPDMFSYNLRLGWRDGADKYFELLADRMNTLGGFDMRKNDMPFLSNDMESLRVGVNLKYPVPRLSGMSVMLTGMHTLTGRNMGKAKTLMAGVVYQVEFKNGAKK